MQDSYAYGLSMGKGDVTQPLRYLPPGAVGVRCALIAGRPCGVAPPRSVRFPGTAVIMTGWRTADLSVFIALRLAGVTDWSWWWVLSPLWISAALVLVAAAALILPFALLALYARVRLRHRLRRSFPEIFIDPAAWSRVPAEHAAEHADEH